MAFTVVLLALLIQWFINLEGRYRHPEWFNAYYQWMKRHFKVAQDWLELIIVVVPPLVVLVVLLLILHLAWGDVGRFILNLIVVWYCLDYDGVKARAKKAGDLKAFLLMAFEKVFTMIFWFTLTGALGVVLYYLVVSFIDNIQASETHDKNLLKLLGLIQGIMEWVPLRLVGITFALVGNFGHGFAAVRRDFLKGIRQTREQAITWAMASLEESDNQFHTGLIMVDRALLLWLVVLALVSMGAWVG